MVRLRDIWQSLYPYGTFRTGRAVYLTFDDGPIPEVTPQVLEILDQYGVKATFFMVGENIDKHPDLFRQVLQAGHHIGNHTYNHLKGWKTPFKEYMANVAKWEEAYLTAEGGLTAQQSNSVSGLTAQRSLFRPPYGKATLRQRIALHKLGYHLIYWDILTRDYEVTRMPDQMFDQIRRNVRPGSIINFHDSLKSNRRMLEVLPRVIEFLQAENYEIQTL